MAISELGMGFYYGGYLNNLTNPLWNGPQIATNNLIIFNMDAPSLTNGSGYDDSSSGRAEGTMFTSRLQGRVFSYISVELPSHTEMRRRLGCVIFSIFDIALEDSH